MSLDLASAQEAIPTSTREEQAIDPGGALLEVRDLTVTFQAGHQVVPAVRGVTFSLARGETMVLLGESGSGKSVTSRAILRLYGSSAETSGSVRLAGRSLLDLDERAMQRVRGGSIGMVPQDPSGSLDPLRRIGAQLVEVLRHHGVSPSRAEAKRRALELLAQVGLGDAKRVAASWPHELSGGMRQRAVIALAIGCNPEVLVADEPTTALDVTVQAQVLELFTALQAELGMAMLLVTHDVGVAREVADHVAVMYAGTLVESGPAAEVLADPQHPYTAGLLAALPRPDVPRGQLQAIPGRPPVAGEAAGAGCAFAPRCPHAVDSCRETEPVLVSIGEGRASACTLLHGSDVPALAGSR